MSTWISEPRTGALAAALALSACAEDDFVTRALGVPRDAPETMAVAGRSVVIGGPPGYCIDKAASHDDGDSAFVLLGSCASIVQDASAARPGVPGLLTASVAEPVPGAPAIRDSQDVLDAFFRSPEGRAALSRNGQAESVTILETRRSEDAFYILLRDISAAELPGMSDTYWRGLFDLNGHLVTVTVVSFADIPFGPDAGFATLQSFLQRIRAETPTRDADAASGAPKPLFARLFR